MKSRLRVYDRRQIAEILEIPPPLVRNWSTGKPFRIVPSLRAPGKRGSTNLYHLEDVYLMGIVARLAKIGIRSELLKAVISFVRKHHELLDKSWQGIITFFTEKGTGKNICWAIPGEPGAAGQPANLWLVSKSKKKPLGAAIIFSPMEVMAEIDRRISKLEKEDKL